MTDLCEAMNKLGKGISNAARYRIVQALFPGPATVGELAVRTGQSQPLVSQHLRVLKEADLVRDERRGQEVLYTLNTQHMIHLLKRLSEELHPKKS